MSEPNSPNELKVPVIEPQLQQQPPQFQNPSASTPEMSPIIKTLDEATSSPSTRFLLVALKIAAYLCILPPLLSLLHSLLYMGLNKYFISCLLSLLGSIIGSATTAIVLFSLEKILKAIMAANESNQ